MPRGSTAAERIRGRRLIVVVASALASALIAAAPAAALEGDPEVEATVNVQKGFFKGQTPVKLTYRVRHDQPVAVRIGLKRVSDDKVMRSWERGPIATDAEQEVRWNGLIDGELKRDARYKFVLTAEEQGVSASTARTARSSSTNFDFHRHKFPIQGPHDYGSSGARFGAPRSGHRHQGQDVMAACGSKLTAARGGKVQVKQYHSAAGHYLVIDGAKTSVDYVYMHLQGPSSLRVGDRVHTGEKIGEVGESGNAVGCHLHFEMWKGGWYEGGAPYDPYPELKDWDSFS